MTEISGTIIKEVKKYLREQGYEDDFSAYILDCFAALRQHYDEYIKVEPGVTDYDTCVRNYLNTLKSIKKINVIRDINNNDYFLRKIEYNKHNRVIGYNKDSEGHYYVTRDKPVYCCSIGGFANIAKNEVSILFDEAAKENLSFLMVVPFHELSHINQSGFYIPRYVINWDLFDKFLKEGNATRESRYASAYNPCFYTIPFPLDEKENNFKVTSHINSISKYLYFKLETLLGPKFMNEWATSINDNTFLYQANKLIDGNYGYGTFKSIYKDIQLILTSFAKYSIKDINNILKEYQAEILIYINGLDSSLDVYNQEYQEINIVLLNENLLKQEHESHKSSLVAFKNMLQGFKDVNRRQIDKLEEKIKICTLEYYRNTLINERKNLINQIDIKSNIRFFKKITSLNIDVYQDALRNSDYLTQAIVDLESVMVRCLLKDRKTSNIEDCTKRLKYYIDNVLSTQFYNSALAKSGKKLIILKFESMLDIQNVSDEDMVKRLTK